MAARFGVIPARQERQAPLNRGISRALLKEAPCTVDSAEGSFQRDHYGG